jgi:hypothetical protein
MNAVYIIIGVVVVLLIILASTYNSNSQGLYDARARDI